MFTQGAITFLAARHGAICVSLSVVASLAVATFPARADDLAKPEVELEKKIQSALRAANPDYQGGGTFQFTDGRLTAINLMRCKGISDLAPLARFPLESVSSVNLYNATNVADIAPLRGCRLKMLNLERCAKISDLAPLKGMPLQWFRMYACSSVKDLAPLEGMPLKHLDVGLNPRIEDISVIQGMPIEDLRIDQCPKIRDISPLVGMPLKFLSLHGDKSIEDYAPLAGLKLETLYFSPELLDRDEIRAVRSMATLKKIGTSWSDYRKEHSPEEFWKLYDAGHFTKKPADR